MADKPSIGRVVHYVMPRSGPNMPSKHRVGQWFPADPVAPFKKD